MRLRSGPWSQHSSLPPGVWGVQDMQKGRQAVACGAFQKPTLVRENKTSGARGCGARGRRGHLLLVVILAIELLVPVEARGLQGLFAGGALHALLVPEAVVEPQQKPVRDDPLTALADRLGAHRSAYRNNRHSLVSRAGQVSPPPGRTRSLSRTAVDVPAPPPGEAPCSSTQMRFGEKNQIKWRC